MSSFQINDDEEYAMRGLPHIARLAYAYLRQHMDYSTGLTGVKRKVTLQSISEYLYVEPHQGIKEEVFSHKQVRSALDWLDRVGLIERDKASNKSSRQSIFKLCLATLDSSVQNKEGRPRADKEGRPRADKEPSINNGLSQLENTKVGNEKNVKVGNPQELYLYNNNNNNNIGLDRKKFNMFLDWIPNEDLLKKYLVNYGLDKNKKIPMPVIQDFRAFWQPRLDLFNTEAQWCSALARWYKKNLAIEASKNASNKHSNVNQSSKKSLVERARENITNW